MSDLTSWVREISTGVIVKILITMIVAALAFLVAYARGFRLRLSFTRRTVVQIVSPGNGAAVGSAVMAYVPSRDRARNNSAAWPGAGICSRERQLLVSAEPPSGDSRRVEWLVTLI